MAIEFGQILCDMPLDVPQPPAIYHHYEDRVQVASPLRWWTANASGATLACILARSTSAAHRRATASGLIAETRSGGGRPADAGAVWGGVPGLKARPWRSRTEQWIAFFELADRSHRSEGDDGRTHHLDLRPLHRGAAQPCQSPTDGFCRPRSNAACGLRTGSQASRLLAPRAGLTPRAGPA